MSTIEELRKELKLMLDYRNSSRKTERVEVIPFEPTEKPWEMVAVDGSYTFLLSLSNMWLALVRAGALTYSCSGNGYHVLNCSFKEKPIMVSTRQEVMMRRGGFTKDLYLYTKGSKEQHREMVNEFRKRLEARVALETARERRNSIIAMDGSLTAVPKELDHLQEVVKACEQNENILVGVSKDSMTHAFGDVLTDEELLKDHKGLGFVRVPPEFEERQKVLLHGDVYFARMHPESPKWFRVDVGTFKDDPAFVFGNLAHYARSAICIGYPYPLMEAHRLAITVRQFREMYEDVLIRAALENGAELDEIVAGLTHMEGERRGAFHEYLDKVSRDLK